MISVKRPRILILGYGPEITRIHKLLEDKNCEVIYDSPEPNFEQQYDLVVSFGYRNIIRPETLSRAKCSFINLHMSLLPYNRGAHPNFWSFYDQTPSGVSIHLIDAGIDTGPILWQKKVDLDPSKMTFRETYAILFHELEALFEDKLENILEGNWQPVVAKERGTFHSKNELPIEFGGWDQNIAHEISRLKNKTGRSNNGN